MTDDIKLIARRRDVTGKSVARGLRRSGELPGIVYGSDTNAFPVVVNTHDFMALMQQHSESTVLSLYVDSEKQPRNVIVKELQRDVRRGDLLHVDLVEISMTQKMTFRVHVELVGESAGAHEGGILEQQAREIEVECLPSDLVEVLEVDVTDLKIGDILHAGDIDLDSKLALKSSKETVIALVSAPHVAAAAEDEEEGAGQAEPGIVGEKKEEAAEEKGE